MENQLYSKPPLPINLFLNWKTKVTRKEQNQDGIFCVIQAVLHSVIAHTASLMP